MVLNYPVPIKSVSAANIMIPDYIETISGTLSSESDFAGLPTILQGGGGSGGSMIRLPPTRHLTWGCHITRLGNGNARMMSFNDASGAPIITIGMTEPGAGALVEVRRGGPAGPLLWTSPIGVFSTTWTFWEFALFIDAAAGTLHVWRDKVALAALTAIDTEGVDADIESWRFFDDASLGNARWRFADGYIRNLSGAAAAWGPVRVHDLRPIADETEQDWAPQAGEDGFAMVDRDRIGQASAADEGVISFTAADRSKWDLSDLPNEVQTVHAVAAYAMAAKPEGGGDRLIVGIDSNAVEDESGPISFSDPAYTTLIDSFETDPNTSGPWTPSAVNALKMFIEHAAAP